MSASQASESANNRSLAFAGVLNKVLVELGHSVDWIDPDINFSFEELNSYDSILVGISPITSLAANRTYGALHIIDLMWDSQKLKFFIDAPQVNQITFSINSIKSNQDSFTKSFFSYRKDYKKVVSDEDLKLRLLQCVDKLANDTWPSVIYPSLPWSDSANIKKLLPINVSNLFAINLDSFLFEEIPFNDQRRDKWVVDTYKTDWAKSTIKTLVFPNFSMKWNKGVTDDQVFDQISRSSGVLITPYKKDGTWWSYRYVQALNALTPIATEWKESIKLGQEWAILAANIEDMSQETRKLLAMAQKDLYVGAVPEKERAKSILESMLGLVKTEENNE